MSIKKRTVYADNTNGIIRFWDWASVTTTVGACIEPFTPGAIHSIQTPTIQFDAEDEIARIDDIQIRSIDQQQLVLGGGQHLQGGILHPRDGR